MRPPGGGLHQYSRRERQRNAALPALAGRKPGIAQHQSERQLQMGLVQQFQPVGGATLARS